MTGNNLSAAYQKDVEAISKIPIIDSLLEVVCRTTGMGFAAVARVTDKQWIACAVRDEISFGLNPGGELELQTTICDEIRQNKSPVIIDHVAADEIFCNHHTPARYGFQSYISFPITLKNGQFFGTLCAIDPKPAQLKNPETMGMFRLFADLISFHLNARDEMALSQETLAKQDKQAELREQFIAILGHDLRNPLGSIMMATELLGESELDPETSHIVKTIRNSSQRMALLIEQTLDFASAQLGSGISLQKKSIDVALLQQTILQITEELQRIWPQRIINISLQLNAPIVGDLGRLSQAYSNLLGNALTHGSSNEPVNVIASSDGDKFELRVKNSGEAIPEASQEKLFEPFYKGDPNNTKKGLGLGLYIVAEIARGHAGKIELNSTNEETIFTLTIPA
ncbi:MAG: GAF domain-containing sensor histidine kinase [Chitinophagaceae bacterium]|nr:MAG: GAF domain-containing sensor histidine kinase [Chitinophagaceae bacterium]